MKSIRKSEQQNNEFKDLELKSISQILNIINKQDQTIADIVKKSIKEIEILSKIGIETINNKGRIIYIGSGASGDIASSDAQEMQGTYGVTFDTFRCIHLQLGPNLDWQNLENFKFSKRNISEDSDFQAIKDLKSINFTKNDLVIGISASGTTAAIIKALKWAKDEGAITACVVMNKDSLMAKEVDYEVVVETGSEVIAGSTRMKCATATKMVLNMFSTTVMTKCHNVYKGLMVGLIIPKEGNKKIENRAINMIMKIANIDKQKAIDLFKTSEQNVKLTLIRAFKKISLVKAKEILKKHKNNLRKILG